MGGKIPLKITETGLPSSQTLTKCEVVHLSGKHDPV